MKETWNDIPEYEGYYQASTNGRVKRVEGFCNHQVPNHTKRVRERVLKQYINVVGYCMVHLSRQNNQKPTPVHRCVALAFLPNPENKITVNHKDGVKDNNHLGNLEWATYSENNKHAHKTGLNSPGHLYKPTIQYDLQGNFIKRYPSAHHAYTETRVTKSNIIAVCKARRNQAGGFKWGYANSIR